MGAHCSLWAAQQPQRSGGLGFFPLVYRLGGEKGVCVVRGLAKVTLLARGVLKPDLSVPLLSSPVLTLFSGLLFMTLQVKAIAGKGGNPVSASLT